MNITAELSGSFSKQLQLTKALYMANTCWVSCDEGCRLLASYIPLQRTLWTSVYCFFGFERRLIAFDLFCLIGLHFTPSPPFTVKLILSHPCFTETRPFSKIAFIVREYYREHQLHFRFWFTFLLFVSPSAPGDNKFIYKSLKIQR